MIEDNKIVKHCKLCLMTNQKPFSINETKNKLNDQKKTTLLKNYLLNFVELLVMKLLIRTILVFQFQKRNQVTI